MAGSIVHFSALGSWCQAIFATAFLPLRTAIMRQGFAGGGSLGGV